MGALNQHIVQHRLHAGSLTHAGRLMGALRGFPLHNDWDLPPGEVQRPSLLIAKLRILITEILTSLLPFRFILASGTHPRNRYHDLALLLQPLRH